MTKLDESIVEITTGRKKRKFLIDHKDYELIKNKYVTVCVSYKTLKSGKISSYEKVMVFIEKKPLMLSRFLMNPPKGYWVDHINGNTRDNRRSNLRIVRPSENSRNRKARGSSKYLGVSWCNTTKKWVASIKINKKNHTLKMCNCEKEAAIAYNEACLKYNISCARLNDV